MYFIIFYKNNKSKNNFINENTLDNDTLKKIFVIIIPIIFLINYLKFTSINLLPTYLFNILSATSVIFTLIIGKIRFNEDITIQKIIGSIIIIIGILYNNIIKLL